MYHTIRFEEMEN